MNLKRLNLWFFGTLRLVMALVWKHEFLRSIFALFYLGFLAVWVWAGYQRYFCHNTKEGRPLTRSGVLILFFMLALWVFLLDAFATDRQYGDYRSNPLRKDDILMPQRNKCFGRGGNCYFPLGQSLLRCSVFSDEHRACREAYRFAGEHAQVWHHKGLVYEMRAGNTVVYSREEQLGRFERQRREISQAIWMLLVLSPLLWWFVWQYLHLGLLTEFPKFWAKRREGQAAAPLVPREHRFPMPNPLKEWLLLPIGIPVALLALVVLAVNMARGEMLLTFMVLLVSAALLAAVYTLASLACRLLPARVWIFRSWPDDCLICRDSRGKQQHETAYPVFDFRAIEVRRISPIVWQAVLLEYEGESEVEIGRFHLFSGGGRRARDYCRNLGAVVGLRFGEDE